MPHRTQANTHKWLHAVLFVIKSQNVYRLYSIYIQIQRKRERDAMSLASECAIFKSNAVFVCRSYRSIDRPTTFQIVDACCACVCVCCKYVCNIVWPVLAPSVLFCCCCCISRYRRSFYWRGWFSRIMKVASHL